jgi:hypothetical protein
MIGMAVTTEDVQEAVKQLWNANATLSDPTTGLVKSLVMGREPDAGVAPYASFMVTPGAITRTSDVTYFQAFVVEFKTWGIEGGTTALGPIQAAIDAAILSLTRTTLTLASTRTLTTLHRVRAPGAMEQDAATTKAQYVVISTDRFEFFCQG